MSTDTDETLYRFPEFFDRLQQRGALRLRDAVESETDVDGIVYHHRGVQVPASGATFLWEESDESFRIELETVGPRRGWARFDATAGWDVYLSLYDGGAIVGWMTNEEFAREEADQFSSKAAAIRAGQFSFGGFFLFGPDWVEREEWAIESTAPGLIQLGDGRVLNPPDAETFWKATEAIPDEFLEGTAPEHLGLREAELRTEIH